MEHGDALDPVEQSRCRVRRAVIHHDHLYGQLHGAYAAEELEDRPLLVVDGDEDAEERPCIWDTRMHREHRTWGDPRRGAGRCRCSSRSPAESFCDSSDLAPYLVVRRVVDGRGGVAPPALHSLQRRARGGSVLGENHRPRPALVLVDRGRAVLTRRRGRTVDPLRLGRAPAKAVSEARGGPGSRAGWLSEARPWPPPRSARGAGRRLAECAARLRAYG